MKYLSLVKGYSPSYQIPDNLIEDAFPFDHIGHVMEAQAINLDVEDAGKNAHHLITCWMISETSRKPSLMVYEFVGEINFHV